MDQPKSPQYVEGMRNNQYKNPTYTSHILPDATSPGKVRGREDTTYKETYPKFNVNQATGKREVSKLNGRSRDEISRHSDAVEARSQFSEQNMSYRTKSSKASQHQAKINEVVKLQPMDARELQFARHEGRDRGNSKDESQKSILSPGADQNYMRSLKRKDTVEWQNPTYKSNIFVEETKKAVPARSSKNWESTNHHDYEMTRTLIKEEEKSHKKPSANPDADLPAYKAWRRQTTEPLQTPMKYGEEAQEYGELPSPARRGTHQPKFALKDHFYQSPGKEATDYARDLNYRYRKDDQIFPHNVIYEGDHNEIVHDEEAARLYQENPIYRQINDGRIGYTNTSIKRETANKILAHEKNERQSAEKRHNLEEEQSHLHRLAELEDRNERLEERRRDYRKQVDDYHKVLAEERYDLSKAEKAKIAKDNILQEAEYVRQIGDMEKLRKQEQMAWYNNELHSQIDNKNRRWVQSDLIDDDLSQQNTGLKLGEYREPSKDQLLHTLKAQVESKNRKLEKFDKVDQVGVNGGDFLGRKDKIDQWNNAYVFDHRRRNLQSTRDNTKLQDLKEQAIRENAQKRRHNEVQKISDVELINDLVVNEKQQRYEEYCRHQKATETLKNAYTTQMKEKEIKNVIEKNERRQEAKGTSFITDGEYNWHAANYDYRGDIQDNAERRYGNAAHHHNDDHHIVENLDNYDKMMLQQERERKRHMKSKLNDEYNSEVGKIEANKQAEIDARKHVRPRIYGENVDSCCK